jgi:hypothetical protein
VGSSNGQIIPLDYNTSALDEMTPRRPGQALAREPGPIITDVDVGEKLGPSLFYIQHASVVMGPRFRVAFAGMTAEIILRKQRKQK